MGDDIEKGSKTSDDFENVYDVIKNLEITGSDNVVYNTSVYQDNMLT